jgi:hypothetical protein
VLAAPAEQHTKEHTEIGLHTGHSMMHERIMQCPRYCAGTLFAWVWTVPLAHAAMQQRSHDIYQSLQPAGRRARRAASRSQRPAHEPATPVLGIGVPFTGDAVSRSDTSPAPLADVDVYSAPRGGSAASPKRSDTGTGSSASGQSTRRRRSHRTPVANRTRFPRGQHTWCLLGAISLHSAQRQRRAEARCREKGPKFCLTACMGLAG